MHCSSLWDGILELTKWAQENGSDPLSWAIQVSSNLNSAGVSMPSFELGNLLISYICWENNVPIAWKFLEKALVLKIVPTLPVLALLSSRSVLYTLLVFVLKVFILIGKRFASFGLKRAIFLSIFSLIRFSLPLYNSQ